MGYQGIRTTRVYTIYNHMKQRCYNENCQDYQYYGGRGIEIYEEWRTDFQAFYDWAMNSGYTGELTIDRIDNDGNYEPGNCRWATMAIQVRNRGGFKTNASGHNGVSWDKNRKQWQAYITVDYKIKHLGRFDSLDDAIAARNDSEARYWGGDTLAFAR